MTKILISGCLISLSSSGSRCLNLYEIIWKFIFGDFFKIFQEQFFFSLVQSVRIFLMKTL